MKIGKLQIRHARILDADCTQGYQDYIELNGEINKDSSLIIKRLLEQIRLCTNSNGTRFPTPIYMNSGGGFLEDGYKIGRTFRKYRTSVMTVLAGDHVCASACAVAFLGGARRYIQGNGVLLFHAPYSIDGSYGTSIKCNDPSSEASLKNYYIEMLGKSQGLVLFDRTMDYCSKKDGWAINTDAATFFGITNMRESDFPHD